jgi:hypothetical protein
MQVPALAMAILPNEHTVSAGEMVAALPMRTNSYA